MSYNNHLKLGYTEVVHKNTRAVTSLNSQEFKDGIRALGTLSRSTGVIPPGYEHRADKIADLFYDDPKLDWLVCWSNNISDPFQQLNVGDRISILNL